MPDGRALLSRANVVALLFVLVVTLWTVPLVAATTTFTGVWAGGVISSTNTVVLNDGAIVTGNVNARGTLQFNQTGLLTISSTLSGTGTLSITNTGSLVLAASNSSWAGATMLSRGTLVVGHQNALGNSGTISFGGGTLQYSSSNSTDYSARYSNAAGQAYSVNTNGQNVTFASSLSSVGSSLKKSGSGTLTLTGSNAHAGGTTVSGGSLQIGAGGTTGLISGNIVNNASLVFNRSDASVYAGIMSGTGTVTKQGAGTITLIGNSTLKGLVSVLGGTLQVGDGGTSGSLVGNVNNSSALAFSRSDATVYAGVISGAGVVEKKGVGTLTLTGNNTYTGKTTISQGSLQLGDGGATGWVSGDIINNGTVIFNRTGVLSYQGRISGTGGVVILSTGTFSQGVFTQGEFALSGSNSFSGGLTLTSGCLLLGNVNSLGTSGGIVFAGGKMRYSSSNNVDYSNRFTNIPDQQYAIDTNGQNIRFASALPSTTQSLAKSGSGTLTLSSADPAFKCARMAVVGGTLAVPAGGSILGATVFWVGRDARDNAALHIQGNTSCEVASIGEGAGSRGLVTVSSGTLLIGGTSYVNSGELWLGQTGTGTLDVRGGQVTSGKTHIGFSRATGQGVATVSGGTWNCLSDLYVGEWGYGTVTVSGGLLLGLDSWIGSWGGSVGTATVSSGTWATSGNLVVGESGTGSLTMTGGLVTVGGVLTTGTYGTINLEPGGTLQIGTGSTTGVLLGGTGNLVNNGTLVFNRSNAFAYSGVVSGSGVVSKQGGGTLMLSGSSTYTGGTIIGGGALVVGNVNALGAAGSVTINSGTLNLNGNSLKINALNGASGATITSGTAGAVMLTSTAATDSTFAGVIANGSGVISFTKAGVGTLTFGGPNTFAGPTTIQQGNLKLAHASALSKSLLSPLAGGTLSLTPNLQTRVGGLNPNAGGLIDIGTGKVTVASGLSVANLALALQSGRSKGSWRGSKGITSSAVAASNGTRTVGWLDNGDGSMTFGYAAAGDANLDWSVDILDISRMLSGGKVNSGLTATWAEGDFNYDGFADILDVTDFMSSGLFNAGPYNTPAGTIAAVPEPSTLGLFGVGVGFMGLMAARRKRAA